MKSPDYATWIFFSVFLLLSVAFAYLNIPLAVLCSMLAACAPIALKLRKTLRLLNECEQRVKERESEIAALQTAHEEELQQLLRSNREAVEDFRSLLSHQLRMPLSIVQGYADLLERDIVTDEDTQKEYLRKIVERTGYISDILTNQLAACRTADEITPDFIELDIIELVSRVGEDMQTLAKKQGIQIQTLSTLDSLFIQGDVFQLNKVIFNILENSLKYMGREGHITILTDRVDDNVCISIKDDGYGLGEEETKHIFEFNYQGSNKTAGHGHGLYMAKCAVEVHSGTISATSSPGMGMAIKIVLPINQASSAAS